MPQRCSSRCTTSSHRRQMTWRRSNYRRRDTRRRVAIDPITAQRSGDCHGVVGMTERPLTTQKKSAFKPALTTRPIPYHTKSAPISTASYDQDRGHPTERTLIRMLSRDPAQVGCAGADVEQSADASCPAQRARIRRLILRRDIALKKSVATARRKIQQTWFEEPIRHVANGLLCDGLSGMTWTTDRLNETSTSGVLSHRLRGAAAQRILPRQHQDCG